MREVMDRRWPRASICRACQCGSSPSQRYRGFRSSSRRARRSMSSLRAAPMCSTRIRDEDGNPRTAMAVRNGSFSVRMWPATDTVKALRRFPGRGVQGDADW